MAGQFQLAEAFVSLSSRGFSGVQSAIGGIQSRLNGLVGTAQQASSRMSNVFASVAQNAAGVALGNIGANIAGKIAEFGKGFVTNNAEFETYQTQFEVLLKSAEKAKARMAELSAFADKTPFELDEVVRASKTLQVFGGDLLATGKSLTLVGDMAAVSGESFDRIAMWVGRAYTAIQSGRPWGEAAMRLQELGLMSGATRQKFEDLEKAGKSGSEVWAEFVKSMDPVSGMMDKLAGTFTGKFSTLKDGITKASRTIGEPIFKAFKEALDKANDALASTGIQDRLTSIAATVRATMQSVRDTVAPIFASIAAAVAPVIERFGGLSNILKALGMGALISGAAVAVTWLAGLSAGAVLLAAKLAAIATVAAPVFNAISGFVQANQERFREWGAAVVEIVTNTFAQAKALALSWVASFSGAFTLARSAVSGLWTYIADGISSTLGVLQRFAANWAITWEMMKTSAALQFSRIVDVASAAWQNIGIEIKALASAIAAVFVELGFRIQSTWKGVQNAIGRVIAGQMAYSAFEAEHPLDVAGAQKARDDAMKTYDEMHGGGNRKNRNFGEVFKDEFAHQAKGLVFNMADIPESDATKSLQAKLAELATKLENAYQNGMAPLANVFNLMGKEGGGLLGRIPGVVNGMFGGLATLEGWLKMLHAPTEADKKAADAKKARDRKGGEVLDVAEFWKRAQEAAMKSKDKDPVVAEVKAGNKIAEDVKKNGIKLIEVLNKPFFGVFG